MLKYMGNVLIVIINLHIQLLVIQQEIMPGDYTKMKNKENPHEPTYHKVIICISCKGFGYIEYSELVNYHKGEYDNWHKECETCGGLGRVVQRITTTIEKLRFPTMIEKSED